MWWLDHKSIDNEHDTQALQDKDVKPNFPATTPANNDVHYSQSGDNQLKPYFAHTYNMYADQQQSPAPSAGSDKSSRLPPPLPLQQQQPRYWGRNQPFQYDTPHYYSQTGHKNHQQPQYWGQSDQFYPQPMTHCSSPQYPNPSIQQHQWQQQYIQQQWNEQPHQKYLQHLPQYVFNPITYF